MMVSFVLSFFPRDVLDEILNLIGSVSEGFPSYSFILYTVISPLILLSLLIVCVFLVPVDSGEKASTSVTIFLSYGIFVSAIRDELPPNSINGSYLLSYIQLLLLFSVFSVIYYFIQSWIFAHYAEAAESCGVLSCMCRNCKPNGKTLKNTNKVNPSKTDGNS